MKVLSPEAMTLYQVNVRPQLERKRFIGITLITALFVGLLTWQFLWPLLVPGPASVTLGVSHFILGLLGGYALFRLFVKRPMEVLRRRVNGLIYRVELKDGVLNVTSPDEWMFGPSFSTPVGNIAKFEDIRYKGEVRDVELVLKDERRLRIMPEAVAAMKEALQSHHPGL